MCNVRFHWVGKTVFKQNNSNLCLMMLKFCCNKAEDAHLKMTAFKVNMLNKMDKIATILMYRNFGALARLKWIYLCIGCMCGYIVLL